MDRQEQVLADIWGEGDCPQHVMITDNGYAGFPVTIKFSVSDTLPVPWHVSYPPAGKVLLAGRYMHANGRLRLAV